MFGSSRFQACLATRIFPNLLHGGRCRDRRADAADLLPEHEHHLAGVDRRRRARSHRLRAGRRRAPAFAVPDRGGRAARAADSLQPQAPRGGPRHRLPLLPHLGGGILVRRHPAHRDVHELPPRDLEGQPDARGGARELPQRPAARVDPRPRPPRLRLLRSQHPRRQGRGLRQLSRARGRHAAHLARGDAAHGLVPRLPPPSRALGAPARARLRHGLAAAGGSGRQGPRAGQGVRDHGPHAPDELRHVSPMSEPGRTWWRSLEELADPAALEALLAGQYPSQAAAWLDPLRRREFLKLMAASLALGGLTACTSQPPEKIVPYVKAPEDVVPGKPLFFATAVAHPGGLGTGVLVESHMGRPTKVEGNPEHPASLGATDAAAQASVLTLYDPDRSQTLTYLGDIRPWGGFLATLRSALGVQRARRGAGLRILTETVTSPTLGGQLRAVLDQYPEARWHQWEPARADAVRAGTLAAFGDDVRPLHRLADADVIVALDADFLGCGPAHLAHVREFAARRRPGQAMNRLYVAESGLTPTGAKADHRLPVRAADVALLARALAAAAGVAGVSAPPADQVPARWVEAVARDLGRHRGRSLVVAGETQPADVQALAHLANAALGNVGHTVTYVPAVEAHSEDQLASLRALVDDMAAGRVGLLVVLGGDPAFNAPADVPFAEAMERVPLRVHLSLYANDTSARSHWVVPAAHYLESWGDVRAFDGTVTIVQPLIAPLYDGKSAHELVAVLAEGPTPAGYDIVRTRWQAERRGADFDDAWRSWLEAGVVPGTALATRYVLPRRAPLPP